MLSIRTQRRLLYLAAIGCAAVAALIYSRLVQPIDDRQPDRRSADAGIETGAVEQVGNRPTPTVRQDLGRLDLRRPLFDPAPVVHRPPPPPPPPPLTVRLVGTIIEPGQSLAVFTTRGGQTQMVGPGQQLDDVHVIEVQADHAVVRHLDRVLTLTLEADQ